ncbi:MAG: glucosyl-3-phosphoglycerate synthase, partial [Mycobacteriales bacterium]
GKGDVLWKALATTSGDLVVFLDADVETVRPAYVTGLLGPLLLDPTTALVKGFYERPLAGGSQSAGGRVTELMARPLLNAVYPQLAGVIQPLSGEYAGRRTLLERLPFASGYGVEAGLLIDTERAAGLDAIAQVDLGLRRHAHQDHHALGRMAGEILQTVLSRVSPDLRTSTALTQFRRMAAGDFESLTTEVISVDRPPIATVAEYADRSDPAAQVSLRRPCAREVPR